MGVDTEYYLLIGIKGDYTDFVKLITKSEKEMLNRYLTLIN